MQKKLLFCLLLAATLSAPLAAQTPTYDISGTVTDAVTGEPLPGVFITYDKRGAQSDYNGRFQLRNVPAGHVALKTMYYSAYPMVTQEIDLRCDTTVHFRLTEQVTRLDEVVVTGTRTPKRLAESPVLTSVITTQEIQRAGSTSTMEVLTDNVPGLVSSSNAMGNNLRIRGLSSRYILFLVDGERMVSEGAGGNINFDQLDVNNIERVEMINGASSALYGSNAVGAVVNIITKKPVHDIEAGANLSWENHNTWRTRAEVGSNLERFTTRASVFRNSSDGYNNSATGGNSSNPYTDYGANLNFGYRPTGRSDLNFTGRYYRHEVFNLPGTMNITHSLDHKMTVGANGGYRSADDRNNVRLSVNFDKYFAYDVIDATGENQRDKTAGYLSARLLDTFRPAERWELTGGAEYNYEDIFSASLFGDAPTTKTIQDANLFAQAEYDPIRNLDIIAGARYTYNDAFGSSFNPKLSVMYSVAGFNFRGGIGTAFRAPSVEELYYDFYHTGGGGFMVYGNPDLKAERGLYSSLSAEYTYRTLNASLSAYYNNIDNKIDQYTVTQNVNGTEEVSRYYRNISSATLRGFDVSLSWLFVRQLTLRLNYSFCDAVDNSTGLQLESNVRHSGTASLTWNGKIARSPFSLQISGRVSSPILYQSVGTDSTGTEIVTKTQSNPYSIWKITLVKPFRIKKHTLEATFKVNNLFDFKDASFTDPGRTFLIGIRYAFM